MHGHKTLKSAFKVIFLLFQAFLFISGMAILIIAITTYLKEKEMLHLGFSLIFYSSIICLLHIFGSLSGFFTIKGKEKFKVALYIITIMALINFQVVAILKTVDLTDRIHSISKKFWENIDDKQKMLVEKSLGCCGYEESISGKCVGQTPCFKVFNNVARGLKAMAFRTIMILIVCESLSVALLCLLKLRK